MRSITFSGPRRLNMPLVQFTGRNPYKKQEQVTFAGHADVFLPGTSVLFSGKRKREAPKANLAPSGLLQSKERPSLDPDWMKSVVAETEPRIKRWEDVKSLDDFSELSMFLRQL